MTSVFEDRESLFLLFCAWLYHIAPEEGSFESPISDAEYTVRRDLLKGRVPWADRMEDFSCSEVLKELRRQQVAHLEFGAATNCLKGGAYRFTERPRWRDYEDDI